LPPLDEVLGRTLEKPEQFAGLGCLYFFDSSGLVAALKTSFPTLEIAEDLSHVAGIKRFISSEKPQRFSRQNISKQSVILHDTCVLAYLGLFRFH